MKLLRATLLGLACALPAVSFAQWQWVDKDGRKVFSDQSPSVDVPEKNILRRPGVRSASAAAAEAASQAAKPAPDAPKLSGKDKQLQEKKKQAEAAEAQKKKKALEDELAKMRADNCVRAKRSKVAFDSGVRVSTINDKGDREYLDDAARAAETKRLQGIIASDCKPAGG